MASVSSGSGAFDRLRAAFLKDPTLRTETEWAFQLAVQTYNPSDRGIRFIIGGIGEWIITLAAYQAGLITMPGGHNEDGHDTVGLLKEQGRALWSVKTSYAAYSARSTFTITNGQNGPGPGLIVPTVFLAPGLPGIVYMDPELHPQVAELVVFGKGETKLAKEYVLGFATLHQECVIPLDMPVNPGAAIRDPGLEAVRILVDVPQFSRLRRMFMDVEAHASGKTVVDQIQRLTAMLKAGDINQEAYDGALKMITGA